MLGQPTQHPSFSFRSQFASFFIPRRPIPRFLKSCDIYPLFGHITEARKAGDRIWEIPLELDFSAVGRPGVLVVDDDCHCAGGSTNPHGCSAAATPAQSMYPGARDVARRDGRPLLQHRPGGTWMARGADRIEPGRSTSPSRNSLRSRALKTASRLPSMRSQRELPERRSRSPRPAAFRAWSGGFPRCSRRCAPSSRRSTISMRH